MGRGSRLYRMVSWCRSGVVLLLALAQWSCLVKDDQCDENQVPVEGYVSACVCDKGSVPNPVGYGCMRCGDHELVKDGKCQCEDGYTRTSPMAPCEKSEIGSSCDPAAPACSEPYTHCAPSLTDPSQGYCTTADCDAAEDCPTGWVCEMGSPRFCSRVPTGQSSPCSSSNDCMDFEASYCALTSMACVVPGCSELSECHGDWVCCDLTALGLTDICIPPARLTDGKCPGGAEPVKP